MLRRRLFFLLLPVITVVLLGGWEKAFAVPAAPVTFTLMQPNGVTFKAKKVGDEWNNWIATESGYTILRNHKTKYWVYAKKADDNTRKLVKTAWRVGIDNPGKIKKGLRPVLRKKPNFTLGNRGKTASSAECTGPDCSRDGNIPPPVAVTENQPILIILVNFTDRTLSTIESDWNKLFFEDSSSVAHFYKEVSYGKLNFQPANETYNAADDGVVVVELPYEHPNIDAAPQVTKDALAKVDPYVDFASFDQNGDSYISTNELHIIVVFAGYERAISICTPSVWAHWASFPEATAPALDGVWVADYSGHGGYIQIGELHGMSVCGVPPHGNDHISAIGTPAHELGHSLWLPDEYDVDATSAGIGAWGLMSGGSWNWNPATFVLGDSPAHPSPWDKWYQGWLTPYPVTSFMTVAVPQIEDIPVMPPVYMLFTNPPDYNPFPPNNEPGTVDWKFDPFSGNNMAGSGQGEYFLVENRQQVGYDIGLPGCGLLIWHISEFVPSDNTANRYEWGLRLVALEQADGFFDLEWNLNWGDPGDPYVNGDLFTPSTTPNSNLYDASVSDVKVKADPLSWGCGPIMLAILDSPVIIVPAAPTDLAAAAVSNSEINLNWVDNSEGLKWYQEEQGFKVERSSDGTVFSQIGATGTDVANYADKGLLTNTIYYYRVAAYNPAGNSEYTIIASTVTNPEAVSAPSELTATPISSVQIDLTWQDNSGLEGEGEEEDGFEIERGHVPGGPVAGCRRQ